MKPSKSTPKHYVVEFNYGLNRRTMEPDLLPKDC